MEQSDCTEFFDNVFVSSPLTLQEAIGTLLINTKEGYWNHYIFHRWMLGYKKVINEKQQEIYIPYKGRCSAKLFNKLTGQCRELARYYTGKEQERIWLWIQIHKN